MAKCIRNGVEYMRHKFKNGTCRCGKSQVIHLREVANRRERRKQARKAAKELPLG